MKPKPSTNQQLRESLKQGRLVLGTLIVSPSPRWPEVVSQAGLDFVFIDTEHIAIDRFELSWMCQTYSAFGVPPLVRIPSVDPNAATMALDGGAAGIIAPYVETAEQVQALRGAVKKRPLKGRRLQDALVGNGLEPKLERYLNQSADQSLLIVNVESTPAIDNLAEILHVPELDGVLIGPHDLSCSLGIPEEYDNPKFIDACAQIFQQARLAKIGAGIHFWGDLKQQARFIELGANMLIHSADITLFQRALQHDISVLRGTTTSGNSNAGNNVTI